MDRQLLERLIGAGVLVLCLVIIAPAILDGPAQDPVATTPSQTNTNGNETRRVHTIRLNERPATPPVAREVTRPEETVETAAPEQASTEPPAVTVARSQAPAPKQVAPAPKTEPSPSPVAKAPPPQPKPEVEPKVEPKVELKVQAETTPAQRPGWAVQLGSFSSRDNAQQLANKVGDSGFPVFLSSVDRSGKKLYRVRVGPLQSRPQAEELAGRLSQAGYTGQVTPQ